MIGTLENETIFTEVTQNPLPDVFFLVHNRITFKVGKCRLANDHRFSFLRILLISDAMEKK